MRKLTSWPKQGHGRVLLILAGAALLILIFSLSHNPATWAAPALNNPTASPASSPTPVATLTPREVAIERAYAFEGDNDDWKPYIETFTFDNGVSIDLALVPVGCFRMGNDPNVDADWGGADGGEQCFDEPFWIGRDEVTNAQYALCVEAGACDEPRDSGADYNAPDQPVVGVSWFNARQYVEWLSAISGLSFSLLTEAEWEYAARGPEAWFYPWGGETPSCDLLNFYGCVGHPVQVGSYSPAGDSWVGAVDMAGNVWEWVNSIHQAYPYDPGDGRESLADTSAWRVLRGGSWSLDQNDARAVFRNYDVPDDRYDVIGFRVCRPLISPSADR